VESLGKIDGVNHETSLFDSVRLLKKSRALDLTQCDLDNYLSSFAPSKIAQVESVKGDDPGYSSS
jgi:hypothetical protein